jgi:hypothetical protein
MTSRTGPTALEGVNGGSQTPCSPQERLAVLHTAERVASRSSPERTSPTLWVECSGCDCGWQVMPVFAKDVG